MNGIIQKKQSRGLFYSLLALILGLCFVRYALQVNIPQAVILAAAVLAIALGDQDEILAMCICCIPLHTAFNYIYVLLFAILMFAAKHGKGIRVNRSIIPVFLMVLWETLHCFGEAFVITQFVGLCLPLLLLMLLMCSTNITFDYDFIVRAFVMAVIGMCVTLLGKLLFVARFNVVQMFFSLQRLGLNSDEAERALEIAGGELNPNTLGILCVIGLTGLFQIRTAGRAKRRDVPMIVFLLVFGAMTSSRTFLACLALMALLLLFSQKGTMAGKIKFLAGIICAAVAALLLLRVLVPGLLDFYLSRFRVKDVTAGRLGLLGVYHDFIMSEKGVLLFGIGLHDFMPKVLDVYRVNSTVPHNGIQELIIAWGLPGLALFTALLLMMMRQGRRVNRRCGLINSIPLLIILFKAQAGQMLSSPYTMMTFAFTYLSLCADLRRAGEAGKAAEGAGNMPVKDVEGVPFGRAAATLWRKAPLIVAVSLLGAFASVSINNYMVTPMYKSSAMFYVNNNSINLNEVAESISSGDISVSRRLVDSYIVILNARVTLDRVIEHTGLDLTYEQLREMIHVLPVNDTEIFQVTVENADPVTAERIANAIAAVFPERISEIIQGTAAKVVDYAVVPSVPSSPGRVVNAMLGFIMGFVFITLVILLKAVKDNTIRAVEDFTELADLPVLAAVPDLGKRAGRGNTGYR